MHIPDGFLSPKTYLPAWALAAVAWTWVLRRSGSLLEPSVIPRLSVTTAAVFVLSMVTIPLPGGTTVHLTFTGLLTALFGFRLTFLALSLVFALQAFLLGDGGVTALPVNVLAIAGAGGLCAAGLLRLGAHGRPGLFRFLAGWTATVVPALLVALVLGLQPRLAQAADGTPLFFPFGPQVTVPALVVPHLVLGILEGWLTVAGLRFFVGDDRRPGHG